MSNATVSVDIFKWVVTGLLGTLALGAGWLLGDIRADLRDVRKEVTAIRVEAATTNTRLEGLIDEGRRHIAR